MRTLATWLKNAGGSLLSHRQQPASFAAERIKVRSRLPRERIFASRPLAHFAPGASGGVAVTFALMAPLLFGASGFAVDYTLIGRKTSALQNAADASALTAAREMRLSNASQAVLQQIVQNQVAAILNMSATDAANITMSGVDFSSHTISVQIKYTMPSVFGRIVNFQAYQLQAAAKAQTFGTTPVCLVGLDPKAKNTLVLDTNAQLVAPGCTVYSNSKSNQGLTALDSAVVRAALICSAGGKYGGTGNFYPSPQLDCPVLADPLASRTQPAVASCTYTDQVISGGTVTLYPGVFCGGLYVTNSAVVTMTPGIYVISNGAFLVNNGASIQGTGVGVFLTGTNAVFDFDSDTTIDLTAPTTGTMAGVLIWESRNAVASTTTGKPAPQPKGTKPPPVPPLPMPPNPKLSVPDPPLNQIISNNARNLLGTIYLPDGGLYVASTAPIADKSAYTIIVAKAIGMSVGPNLILNTNYGATNVPVPMGLGPTSGNQRLLH